MLSEHDLNAILAIYRTGSFHKASEFLYISQPALSSLIGNLEKRLGVTLFERSKKGAKPTPVCETLLPLVINILEQINAFKILCSTYSLSHNFALRNIPITISSYPLITSSLLPELLSSLKLHLPQLNLMIKNLDMNKPRPMPEDNEIIIYLARTDTENDLDENIQVHHICTVEPTVLMHKDYLTPLPSGFDEQELVTYPIITILRSYSPSSLLTNSIIKHLLTLKADLELIDVTSSSVCNAFLEKKLGVSFALQFDSVIAQPVQKNLVALPLHHTNKESFALSFCCNKTIPCELSGLIINLARQTLLTP